MISYAAFPFLAATIIPLGTFLATVVRFFSNRSATDPKFPPLLLMFWISARRPVIHYSILATAFSIALLVHAVFSRLGRVFRTATRIRIVLVAVSGFGMAFTVVGFPYFSPLRSPNLSLANGVGFALSACFFHSLLDDLPHRQSLATRFVRPLGFVLIISSFLGFFPFLTGMATVQWTSLQELRYLCQSIAFCVTFVKVGLVGAQILGSRARRSDEGGTPARKPPEYVGV